MQKRIHTKTHATKTNKRDLKIIFNYINNSPNRYDRRINRFSNWRKDYIQKIQTISSKEVKAKAVTKDTQSSKTTESQVIEKIVEKVKPSEVEQKLKAIDINELTPRDALNLLYDLKALIKE